MKKLLYALIAVSIIFSACEKEEEELTPTTPLNPTQIIVDKIWKGRVLDYQNTNDMGDIIFELRSNDSLYVYTSGCTPTTTNIGTWNIYGKVITYNRVVNLIEYTGLPFGELTEYNETQLKFKVDTNINSICEIYDLVTQNCTYIPDFYFEQGLINLGYDNVMDNYVNTANIETITSLDLQYWSIYDLTGIEDFTALIDLNCSYNYLTSLDVSNNTALSDLRCFNNQLTSLDVSNNTDLINLTCSNNQLTSLDVRNGNSTNMNSFHVYQNLSLSCIDVDYPNWSTSNWFSIDFQHYFSANCSAK